VVVFFCVLRGRSRASHGRRSWVWHWDGMSGDGQGGEFGDGNSGCLY